jgi:hypothetical protein
MDQHRNRIQKTFFRIAAFGSVILNVRLLSLDVSRIAPPLVIVLMIADLTSLSDFLKVASGNSVFEIFGVGGVVAQPIRKTDRKVINKSFMFKLPELLRKVCYVRN